MDYLKAIFLGPINDMKTIPGTATSVLLLWCVMMYSFFVVLPGLARGADVAATQKEINAFKSSAETLQKSVAVLDTRLRYDAMRRTIEDLDRGLYSIAREMQKARAAGNEPAEYLVEQQREFQARRTELQERIAAMLRTNPELVYQ